jgi:hypothetical protein
MNQHAEQIESMARIVESKITREALNFFIFIPPLNLVPYLSIMYLSLRSCYIVVSIGQKIMDFVLHSQIRGVRNRINKKHSKNTCFISSNFHGKIKTFPGTIPFFFQRRF